MNKDKKPLSETHPELAKEAHGWDPKIVQRNQSKKYDWVCSRGHVWDATIHKRKQNQGCPFCSSHRLLLGFNDLATTHPELAKEAHGWDPKTVIAGTAKKLDWKCSKGHIWKATGNTRVSGSICGVCSNRQVLAGFNDLATTHPELAIEAHGWDPKTVIAGTNKKLEWKCSKGHIWKAMPNVRAANSVGCAVCSNQKVLTGFNDLATTHPELAKEAHDWDPKTVIAGTNKKLEWKCSKGHIWLCPGYTRIKNLGCPVCSNQKVLAGFNDLATTHPELAKEAHGWDPKTVIAGTHRKLEWKCSKGHIWKAVGSSRTIGQGCPSCANYGFDPNQNGYFYFLIQPKWEVYQIGITNFPDYRLKSHNKNGFELLELRGPIDGHSARELETAILRYLKSQKADLSPEHVAGKFDGYSESWTMDSYKVNNLKELIDKASEAGF